MIHSNTFYAKYSRNRYTALRKLGRCTKCGGRDERTDAGRCVCSKCHEKFKKYKVANEKEAENK